jgi:hypothetical protein
MGPSGFDWRAFASSVDGSNLMAVVTTEDLDLLGDGYVLISRDSGTTWAVANLPFNTWSGVASSADGCKLVATAYRAVSRYCSPGIYTFQSAPTPCLGAAPLNNNLLLSWLVPSTNFALQQNLDLTTSNWTDVTNASVINCTNLKNEVTMPMAAPGGFYRLKTP